MTPHLYIWHIYFPKNKLPRFWHFRRNLLYLKTSPIRTTMRPNGVIVQLRVNFFCLRVMEKWWDGATKGVLPGEMANMLRKNDHGHLTRGARSNLFVEHSDGRSIRSIAPRIWNSLSTELKQSPSIASFKERSKLDLLGPYGAFVCSVRGCFSCAGRP